LAGLRNLGAQQDCTISGEKVGYPPEMHNFLSKGAQAIIGPTPSEQHVRGSHQDVIDVLPLCKTNIEACELDEEKLEGRLQNESKEKFWRVVVAATTLDDTLLAFHLSEWTLFMKINSNTSRSIVEYSVRLGFTQA